MLQLQPDSGKMGLISLKLWQVGLGGGSLGSLKMYFATMFSNGSWGWTSWKAGYQVEPLLAISPCPFREVLLNSDVQCNESIQQPHETSHYRSPRDILFEPSSWWMWAWFTVEKSQADMHIAKVYNRWFGSKTHVSEHSYVFFRSMIKLDVS